MGHIWVCFCIGPAVQPHKDIWGQLIQGLLTFGGWLKFPPNPTLSQDMAVSGWGQGRAGNFNLQKWWFQVLHFLVDRRFSQLPTNFDTSWDNWHQTAQSGEGSFAQRSLIFQAKKDIGVLLWTFLVATFGADKLAHTRGADNGSHFGGDM